jgi:signal transduction histidine kinase
VLLSRGDAALSLSVGDAGRGGAQVTAGGGLAGLRDRVEALDGTLTIESSREGGTTIHARIPCES